MTFWQSSRRGVVAETSRAVGALLVMRAMLESALEVRGRCLPPKEHLGRWDFRLNPNARRIQCLTS